MANQGLVNYGAYRSFALPNGTTTQLNLCNEHKYRCSCIGITKRIWFIVFHFIYLFLVPLEFNFVMQ